MDLGSLKRALINWNFHLRVIWNKSTYDVDMNREKVLAFQKFTIVMTFDKEIMIYFSLNVMLSIFKHMKIYSSITLVVHICEIA